MTGRFQPGRYSRRTRNPPPAPQLRANTPVPQLPDDINGTDQALHSARTPSAEHHSPATDSAPRDRKPGSGQDPHKIPTPHATHRPCQHHAEITASRYFRWSETRLASSRDRTRTYNLPVNRRPVTAGGAPGLSAASPCPACIKALAGLTRPCWQTCRLVPDNAVSSVGFLWRAIAADADLWGFCGGAQRPESAVWGGPGTSSTTRHVHARDYASEEHGGESC